MSNLSNKFKSNYSLRNEYFYLNLHHKVFQNGKLRKKENEKSYPKLTTYTQPQYIILQLTNDYKRLKKYKT